MQRLVLFRTAPISALALVCAQRLVSHDRRHVGSEEPGAKKAKVNLDDDDRWLEAEFDEKLRSPEERYAHERQMLLMKSLIKKMRSEHHEKLQTAVDERNEQVHALKKQMNDLQEQLDNLTKK